MRYLRRAILNALFMLSVPALGFVAPVCPPAYAQRMPAQGPEKPPAIAFLNVQGQGLAPDQAVTLSTGPQQELKAQTAPDGTVLFSNLKYLPSTNLTFALSFQVKDGAARAVSNTLLIDLDPFTGSVKVEGNATRAASVVVNVSSEDSKAMVANQKGYFIGRADSRSGLSKGALKVVASIINVEETCCPRNLKPFVPVTFTISGQPTQDQPGKKAAATVPEKSIVAGRVTVSSDIELPMQRYGSSQVSVPPELINGSWVTGLYNFANEIHNALVSEATSLGGFITAQMNNDSRRALQKAAAETANNSAPSEQLCRFATLTQSLVSSESKMDVNKLSMSRALLAREMGSVNMLGAEGDPTEKVMEDYTAKFCDPNDGNAATRHLCTNKQDTRYNMDVNYSRVIDTPMTLDVDFAKTAGAPATVDEENIMALIENLFPSKPLKRTFNDPDYLQSSNLYRSLQAIRGVAKNSLISLVTEKSKGTASSAKFITNLMTALGLSEGQAQSLMGANPSYYAQMEALTKSVFQDPAFYINLIDTPTNVERQRTAIRAIKLQQQNDFAQSVKRREMLLSLLLELKLRERAKIVNQRIANADGH